MGLGAMLGSAMINRIKALLASKDHRSGSEAGRRSHDELQLAAACLLLEAAALDGCYGEKEKAAIDKLLRDKFSLNDEEAISLHELAVAERSEANQLIGFTRVIKDHYSPENVSN